MSWDGVEPGEPVAVVVAPDRRTAALARTTRARTVSTRDATLDDIAELERSHHPRWVWWGAATATRLVEHDVRPVRCWDLDAVHRLQAGGWRGGPARVWAAAHDLDPSTIPTAATPDLFSPVDAGDPEEPVGDDGHLRPGWVDGGWADSAERRRRWAALALDVYGRQHRPLTDPHHRETARSESAAALLGAELGHDGLPIDLDEAERIIAGFVGPRPSDAAEAAARIRARDELVLRHLPAGLPHDVDLRSPGQVRSLLRSVGVEVPDTRAWRLEQLRDAHPAVDALLAWRRAERIATTFGYSWLDEHVRLHPTLPRRGRLCGRWSSADGAAGRMTATAGLHNLPAELRPAVAAEPGHVFVRADLGQIEPRVLAAVAHDDALARATQADDLYLPVARALQVEREIAKVAVLGAMYGQTTGKGAEALHRLERAYPVAMGFLRHADEAAQGGRDLHTYGGRRVRMSAAIDPDTPERDARSRAAARGRFGRNAVIQGAAAELFKTWAVLVRARGRDLDARIVLCLHDELLVHVPDAHGVAAASLVDDCLAEAAARWAPAGSSVRFVAETTVVARWSDAK